MRIIAGQRRGHKIESPTDKKTRPTSDMVRESIFNLLGAEVEGAVALDLFAGTGALGLEALSRGAVRAIFVDIDRELVSLIRRNTATLRYEDRASIFCADVYRFMKMHQPDSDRPTIVFIDPPYREYENHPERVRRLLEILWERLPAGSAVVLETGEDQSEQTLVEPWEWDARHYGGTEIAIAWKPNERGPGDAIPTDFEPERETAELDPESDSNTESDPNVVSDRGLDFHSHAGLGSAADQKADS